MVEMNFVKPKFQFKLELGLTLFRPTNKNNKSNQKTKNYNPHQNETTSRHILSKSNSTQPTS
jgi:hypothetical protein